MRKRSQEKQEILARICLHWPGLTEPVAEIWLENTENEMGRIKKIFEGMPELSFRLEQPRPLKKKGKTIGLEPFKLIIGVSQSFTEDSEWLTAFASTLFAVCNPSSVHAAVPKNFSYQKAKKVAA